MNYLAGCGPWLWLFFVVCSGCRSDPWALQRSCNCWRMTHHQKKTIWLWLTVCHGQIHPFWNSVSHLWAYGPSKNHGKLLVITRGYLLHERSRWARFHQQVPNLTWMQCWNRTMQCALAVNVSNKRHLSKPLEMAALQDEGWLLQLAQNSYVPRPWKLVSIKMFLYIGSIDCHPCWLFFSMHRGPQLFPVAVTAVRRLDTVPRNHRNGCQPASGLERFQDPRRSPLRNLGHMRLQSNYIVGISCRF